MYYNSFLRVCNSVAIKAVKRILNGACLRSKWRLLGNLPFHPATWCISDYAEKVCNAKQEIPCSFPNKNAEKQAK